MCVDRLPSGPAARQRSRKRSQPLLTELDEDVDAVLAARNDPVVVEDVGMRLLAQEVQPVDLGKP